MNILAHYVLSEGNEEVIVGNMIADFLKGSKKETFSYYIQKGIDIHRKIDMFSDQHEVVKQTWSLLQEPFGHYGRVITDIYYDHFLCFHWHEYSANNLDEDLDFLYQCVDKYSVVLPPKVRRMTAKMVAHKWPSKYADMTGLHQVFRGMSRRASFKNSFEQAVPVLQENYEAIHEHFCQFFPELKTYIEKVSENYKSKKT
jgi:acyl carrier protein phosphodiesterase